MNLNIFWTPEAKLCLDNVLEYLSESWSQEIANKFEYKTKKVVESIALFPKIGVVSNKFPQVRSILITKHNRLYYRINNNNLIILTIFDTRLDPLKNKY